MNTFQRSRRSFRTFFLMFLLLSFINVGAIQAQEDGQGTLVRAYFPNEDLARDVVRAYNALESEYEKGYLVMSISQADMDALMDLGFIIETVDVKEMKTLLTASAPDFSAEAGLGGIPGYSCYRTVEETFADAAALATNNSTLADWLDVGDSWQKQQGLGGYDIRVLKLTNKNTSGAKPKLFLTGSIHAREYATAELVMRFGEYLVEHYGSDADATWILDNNEVHLMIIANPDARKKAEAGNLWRKNTNQNYCGSTSNNRGADLNRNFSFSWGCCNGSSGSQCEENYRGPSKASEPETKAVEAYVRANFDDNRGPGVNDPADEDTTGIYIDIHSHGRLILWPWGHTKNLAPNATALQTMGRKLAYWNNYKPQQSIGLYATDGTTDGVGYGELGVPTFIFELGNAFFQGCSYFQDTIIPQLMPSLIYAAKAVRAPYKAAAGPDCYDLSLSAGASEPGVPQGAAVTLTATVSDTRYYNGNGSEPTQNVAAARYYIDTPPWKGGSANNMSAADGGFNSGTEAVKASIDTSSLSEGKHLVFVEGRDSSNNWGVMSAIYLYIDKGQSNLAPKADFTYSVSGLSVTFTDASADPDGSVVKWSWSFGDNTSSSQKNPTHSYAKEGNYTVTLTVTDNDGLTGDTTQTVSVGDVKPPYCSASGKNQNYEWIAGVAVGNLDNASGAAGYTDYTAMSVKISYGDKVDVTLTPGFASDAYSESWKIWIDLTEDGDFDDGGEEVFSSSGKGVVTGSFTIPALPLGKVAKGLTTTRMRVAMRYNNAPEACGGMDYGEVEDYSFIIDNGSTTPPVAAFSANTRSVRPGDSVIFTDHSTENPTTWSWTFDGGTPSQSRDRNPSIVYERVGTFSVTLEVSNDGGSDSETQRDYIVVDEQSQDYCASSGKSQQYEWIQGVKIGSVNHDSNASGYTDYTASGPSISARAGDTVNVTLTPGFSSSKYLENWRIWIDLNKDGDFNDQGEEVFSKRSDAVVTDSFTLPSTARGATRLRVIMKYANDGVVNACDKTFEYGEVEDYAITIN